MLDWLSCASSFVYLGRISSEDEKRVCSRETCSQREHILMNFAVPEGVSEVNERARERSKAERCV